MARGDARYYTETETDTLLSGKETAGAASAAVSAHEAAVDPHTQYTTAAEVSSAIGAATIANSQIAQNGATLNQALVWNGSAWAPATVSASPGGSTTELQYNNAGAFAGIPGATFSSNTLRIVSQAAGAIPFAIQAATSQTGNLTEWRNSVGAISTRITSSGAVYVGDASMIRWNGDGARGINAANAGIALVNQSGVAYAGPNSAGVGWIVGSNGEMGFSSSAAGTGPQDAIFMRVAAAIVGLRGASGAGAALSFVEQTAPAAPATNGVYLYSQDNGAGKTQLMARFATGAAQQVAIEP